MVDIEVDNGDPIQPVHIQRMLGSQRSIAEETKAHRFVMFRVMSRRAHGCKGVLHVAPQNQIHRFDRTTCCAQGGAH